MIFEFNKAKTIIKCLLLTAVCILGASGCGRKNNIEQDTSGVAEIVVSTVERSGEESETEVESDEFTVESRIVDIIGSPVFGDYGRLIFPVDFEIDDSMELKDISSILPWYSEIIRKRLW